MIESQHDFAADHSSAGNLWSVQDFVNADVPASHFLFRASMPQLSRPATLHYRHPELLAAALEQGYPGST